MVRSASAGPNHTTLDFISNENNFICDADVLLRHLSSRGSDTPCYPVHHYLGDGAIMLIRVQIVDLNWEGKNLTDKEKLDLTRKVEKSYVSFDDDLTDDEISDKLHDLIKQQTKCEADLISWFPVDDPIFIL